MQLSELYEISERQINALKSAHIETEQDLLGVYPKRYYDMNNIGSLNKAADGSRLGIVGILKSIKNHVTRAGDRMTVATVTDKNSGNILRVNWLREPYRFNMYSHMIGQEIYVLGKISYQESMDSYSLFSPTIFRLCDTNLGIYSEYSPVRGISDENFKVCLGIALKHYNKEETLPEELLKKYKLYGLKGAYRAIHFPTDLQDIINAKKRLIFDDLLFFALLLVESEKKMSQGTGFVLRSLKMMRIMERDLPFQLTEGHGQKDVLESILSDMRSGKRVDAMVQGDVGCGKTIVAFLLMFAIAENGGQCVLTVIVVNNAERFGMSSLHQLRGRVGRGSDQAFCILKSDDTTNMRLRVIAASTSGFEIAEEDCKLRGVGNLVGIEQTGKNKYLMLAIRYPKMFEKIRQIAERLYENGQSQNFIERYMEERYDVKR